MCLFLCSYCCWLSLWRHCLKSINGRRMPRADERHKNCNMGPLSLLTLYPLRFREMPFYFHSTAFHSISLHSIAFHYAAFHFIPLHWMAFQEKGGTIGDRRTLSILFSVLLLLILLLPSPSLDICRIILGSLPLLGIRSRSPCISGLDLLYWQVDRHYMTSR